MYKVDFHVLTTKVSGLKLRFNDDFNRDFFNYKNHNLFDSTDFFTFEY